MNKIGLVFKREYLTRVRNKTFLLSTFLLPLVFVAFIFGTAYLSTKGTTKHNIAVYDPNNYFKGLLKQEKNLKFGFVSAADTPANVYSKNGYTGLLILPKWDGKSVLHYEIRSPQRLGISANGDIEDQLNNAIQDNALKQQGITTTMLDTLRKNAPHAEVDKVTDQQGNVKSSSGLAYGIGFGSGILIYLMMFIYGAMVMRGVMEEKTSRIAEVIVSSVKPFQLMMGKILGIGAVGLTQFLLWMILIFGLAAASQVFLTHDTLQNLQDAQQSNPMGGNAAAGSMAASEGILGALGTANWAKIVPCFLFYFLGGYLFYAALFASVGCMVNEDPQEAQSLMLPITMPIVFGFIIMQGAIQNPDSSLAFWGSIIPFTSPIVMMARIPSDPPLWQILLSMALLIGGFIGTSWMAGKIYRTGILMYGKKGSWKQMMKWVFAKS